MTRNDTMLLLVSLGTLSAAALLASGTIVPMPEGAEYAESVDAEPIDTRTFIREAAKGGKAEVELGRLAIKRARSEDVRGLAERMVRDHGDANRKLAAVAADHGIADLPGLDEKQKQVKSRLESVQGADFDKAFAYQMVVDHQKAIDLFGRGRKVEDESVRRFARETLPILRRHAEQVARLAG